MIKNGWAGSSAIPSSVPAPAPRSREERNKQAALNHANILQFQKDTELRILQSLEKLIDLPSSSNSDPAKPSSEDARILQDALTLFQPSDYDALIEERNINRSCGYTLCPRANKLQKTSAERIIVCDRGKVWDPLKVVDKKTLERWCSDKCGKRALFLKVQLQEEPAWERAGRGSGSIKLLDETRTGQLDELADDRLASKLGLLSMSDDKDRLFTAMREHAIERGDSTRRESTRLVDVRITEKRSERGMLQRLPTSGQDLRSSYNAIEGYVPRGIGSTNRSRLSMEVDREDDAEHGLSSIIHND